MEYSIIPLIDEKLIDASYSDEPNEDYAHTLSLEKKSSPPLEKIVISRKNKTNPLN